MLSSNANLDIATFDAIRSILQPEPVLDTYSADFHQGLLYTGGWRTRSDIGPNKIYSSPSNTDAPRPIVWNGYDPYQDWHLNDPSVVDAPDGSHRLFMYVTGLANTWSSLQDITNKNLVMLATSTDAGATWTWNGAVVGQSNGLDGSGAWSPSALVRPASPDGPSKVDLWYHTGNMDQVIWRPVPGGLRLMHSVMDSSGKVLLSTRAATRADTGDWLRVLNPDVARGADGTMWMVGEATPPQSHIVAYRSADGGNSWTPWGSGGLGGDMLPSMIDGKTVRTPSIMAVDPGGNGLTLACSLTDNADPFDPASAGASHVWTDVVHVAFKPCFSVYGANSDAPGTGGDNPGMMPQAARSVISRGNTSTRVRETSMSSPTPPTRSSAAATAPMRSWRSPETKCWMAVPGRTGWSAVPDRTRSSWMPGIPGLRPGARSAT